MLHIHNRQTRTAPAPRSTVEALRRAFFTDDRTPDQLAVARAALADLHRQRLWLACDCAQGPDDTWPMIGPRDGRGGMHPFRFGHVAHRGDCPFAAAIRPVDLAESGPDEDGQLEGLWDLTALFPVGQDAAERQGVMSRLLRTALAQLGYDRLHVSSFASHVPAGQLRMLETPFARLRHLGGQEIGGSHLFRDVGTTYLPALPRLLSTLGRTSEPAGTVCGLFVGITEEITLAQSSYGAGFVVGKDQRGGRCAVPVQGDIRLPVGDDGRHGPYWTLALCVADGDGRCRLGDVLLLHALDRRTLLPVPSEEHRALARLLLEQMHFWRGWKRLELEVELAAPLFPSPYPRAPAFELVLPDAKRLSIDLAAHVAGMSDHDQGVILVDATLPEEKTRRLLTGAVAKTAAT